MSDYISRQAAIKKYCENECGKDFNRDSCGCGDDCATIFDDIPAADVRENVKGRWVEVVDRTEMYDKEGVKTWGMLFQCNQCGFVLNAIEGHTGQYNYCPNCGADMRGEA